MDKAAGFWTNSSVLALAGDRDPVEVVGDCARDLVFKATENGWTGPPYDPFALAAMLNIAVVPHEALGDARIVPAGSGARIEFNPTRPRARVRFSVAHELAHTFFPDFQDAIRYRGAGESAGQDDWQIELLCNMAAGELLMPVGSFTTLEDEPLRIETLMELRRQYEVSTEALLLRVSKLTRRPCAVFAASRVRPNDVASPFRIDYVAPSPAWDSVVAQGARIPNTSVLGECTAVGYTAKSTESWGRGAKPLRIECVGLPPFPGATLPRVAGLLLPEDEGPTPRRIRELVGDARAPRGDGPHIIAHIVNDRTANWGGAFARVVAARWPEAQEEFKSWAAQGGLDLGTVHVTELEAGLKLGTMVAQKGYGRSANPRIRYAALEACLQQLAAIAKQESADIHMPRIGTGAARGDWAIIREIINSSLIREGIDVTVYVLPGTPVAQPRQTSLAIC